MNYYLNISIILFLLIKSGLCQSTLSDQIIHINLRFTVNQIELLNTKITTGKLKSIHQKKNFTKDDLYFEIIGGNDKNLYHSTIANPLIKYIEYGDENGKLSRVKAELDTAFISIRSPYHPDIDRLDFYKVTGIYNKNVTSGQNLKKMASINLNLNIKDE